MDLGIAGRWALVTGGSRGLGLACATALAAEGVNLVVNARTAGPLEAACDDLRRTYPVEVRAVAADIRTEEGRRAVLAAAPQVDILVTSGDGPPPGGVDRFQRDDWIAALDIAMLAPLEMIKAVLGPMMERGFGRIVNVSAALVKAPTDQVAMASMRGVLAGVVNGLARKAAPHNVTINTLLPGAFDTGRLENQARAMGVDPEVLRAGALAQIPAGRMGSPEEFGTVCAFLCGAQAGYLTRHGLVLDGAAFPGLL